MTGHNGDKASDAGDRGAAHGIAGILERDTMEHLLDVEFARARRYEHPFALLCVKVPSSREVQIRLVAGALRLHTRWADSVGMLDGDGLLVILRDTRTDAARAAAATIAASVAEELGADACEGLVFTCAAWRKGDDRERLLSRLAPVSDRG